jgi:hypothetical protein
MPPQKRSTSRSPAQAQTAAVVPAAAASSITIPGVKFSFVYGTTTYDVQVYAPDSHGQYGFMVSQGNTVVAALTYKDEQDWQIAVGLPAAFKVDGNLTINSLNVNIQNGTIVPLS